MAASQQILFAETIAGMKKAFRRKAYESDSDSEIETGQNRGRKLKKGSRFAHRGQLIPQTGPNAYKEPVDYAGVRRSIIHRNPPLVDDEGYEIDSELDDDDRIAEAEEAAAELNPYSNIRIENILAPLTASTDLPIHPAISKPFVSQTLTDLCTQSDKIMRKENQSLWQVRHLWTSLCGDGTWMPAEAMLGPDDANLYNEDHVAQHLLSLSRAGQADSALSVNGDGSANHQINGEAPEGSSKLANDAEGARNASSMDIDRTSATDGANFDKTQDQDANSSPEKQKSGLAGTRGQIDAEMKDAIQGESTNKGSAGHNAANLNSQANGELTGGSNTKEPFVHPMFLSPNGVTLDRDLGLPDTEAETIRRLLALYVQKQEEICRGTQRLNQGLLRAEHLRKEVLHWSKAEAHRDMSDGEDWYDKDEWGLTEDLKKGQDEEEEDTTTTGKKTRARRVKD